jgi:uncharacterized protein (TIGR02217 family)
MPYFLEERFTQLIRYGSTWSEEFAVQASQSSGGDGYKSLDHPYPRRTFDASIMLDTEKLWNEVVNVYMRAYGKFAGFRVRCFDEWSTNGQKLPPTAFDQPMGLVSAGVYELRKYYGRDKAPLSIGYPFRKLKKPVAGTTLVGIGATAIRSADWSVDTTTGLVTFAANQTRAVTSITKAAQAVLDVGAGHPFVTGMSLHVSGAAGMTQINGLRALVTGTGATTVTLAINSTAFSTYTSGGVVHTRPQTGEAVTAGTEFDFPVEFTTALPVGMTYPGWRPVESLILRELLNP